MTGGQGMLGWDLFRSFQALDLAPRVIAADRRSVDITSDDAIASAIAEYRPVMIVNSAAYTNVDGAETEQEKALAINATGAAKLAAHCSENKIKLVHFSTDQVFDGVSDHARTEDETPQPVNHYAKTKWLGEQEVLKLDSALVLRVQWLYGLKKDRFTVLKDKEVFTPFSDQFGAPTWTKNIAAVLAQMLEKDARGLFHLTHDDFASWAEVYQFVKQELNLKTRLEPRKTEEVSLPARRPKFSVLSNRKLAAFLGRDSLGSWKDSLREFLSLASLPEKV